MSAKHWQSLDICSAVLLQLFDTGRQLQQLFVYVIKTGAQLRLHDHHCCQGTLQQVPVRTGIAAFATEATWSVVTRNCTRVLPCADRLDGRFGLRTLWRVGPRQVDQLRFRTCSSLEKSAALALLCGSDVYEQRICCEADSSAHMSRWQLLHIVHATM